MEVLHFLAPLKQRDSYTLTHTPFPVNTLIDLSSINKIRRQSCGSTLLRY